MIYLGLGIIIGFLLNQYVESHHPRYLNQFLRVPHKWQFDIVCKDVIVARIGPEDEVRKAETHEKV